MAEEKDKDRREREEEGAARAQGSPRGRPSLRGLARRVFGDGDEEPGTEEGPDEEPREEARRTRELLGAALATGDKARMELVRLVAREVRSYLEALELHKDLHHLLTNYSLEVHASVSLKPLSTAPAPDAPADGEAGEPGVRVGLRRKSKG